MATGRVPTTANSPLTAKGDLFGYSTTQARVPVGNDGETIVADSSTSTGLRYQGSMVAGKNAIINGGLDIWQRGTSSTTNGITTADRWYNGGGSGTTTFARESTIVPTGSTYSMKVTTSTTTNVDMNQAIESLNAIQFAGQKVTISYKAAASASVTVFTRLYYSTSTDVGPTGSWTQITADSGGSGTVSTTASFSTISGIYTVPSTAKSLIVVTGTTSLANGTSLYMGQIQLELGSVPTTFSRAGGTIQGELAACQRYYYRNTGGQNYSPVVSSGVILATTNCYAGVQLPVQMRREPTSVEVSALQIIDSANTTYAVTSAAISTQICGTSYAGVEFAATGMTVGRTCLIRNANNSAAYLGFNAEL